MLQKIRQAFDAKLVPSWRSWYKLTSMRLGVIAAAGMTYLTEVPSALNTALNMLPDWMRSSLPVWVGPTTLGILFVARFWDQTKPAPTEGTEHGAE